MGIFRDIRGSNYLPCEARAKHNAYLFLDWPTWGTFDLPTIRAELDEFAARGGTWLRVFQSFWGWQANKLMHEANLATLSLEMANRGIRMMLTFFEGVQSSPLITGVGGGRGPQNEPWYDLLGANGTQSWSPLAETNTFLVNPARTGLVDRAVAQDTLVFSPWTPHPRFESGGWFAAPGWVYAGLFPFPSSPTGTPDPVILANAQHLELIASFSEYIRRTGIAAIAGGSVEVFDVCNEFDICYKASELTVWNANHPAFLAEFANPSSSSITGKRMTASIAGILADEEGRIRGQSFMRWAGAVSKLHHPTIPITWGMTSLDPLLICLAAPEGPLVGDFGSFHNYGNGRIVARENMPRYYATVHGTDPSVSGLLGQLLRANVPQDYDLVLSEFSVNDVGEFDLEQYFWGLVTNGIGGFGWGYYKTQGFGKSQPAELTSWAPAGGPPVAPFFDLWPRTGTVHSTINPDTGLHEFLHPRPIREDRWRAYLSGDSIPEPSIWEIQPASSWQFHIVDQFGNLPTHTWIVWKWAVTDELPGSIPLVYHEKNWAHLPGVHMVDTPFWRKLPGYSRWNTNPVDVNIELVPAGKVLLLSALLGSVPWDPDQAITNPNQEIFSTPMAVWTPDTVLAFLGADGENDRARIVTALRDAIAEAQEFYPQEPSTTGTPSLLAPVKPDAVEVEEIVSQLAPADLESRGLRQDTDSWLFEARVRFHTRRVASSFFEDRVSRNPIILTDEKLGQVTLTLAEAQWDLPGEWQGSNGTFIRYLFKAVS